jgi:hypothetical protein
MVLLFLFSRKEETAMRAESNNIISYLSSDTLPSPQSRNEKKGGKYGGGRVDNFPYIRGPLWLLKAFFFGPNSAFPK